MKKQFYIFIFSLVLILTLISVLVHHKSILAMKNTTSNIAFWVLDAQKLDSAFIYKDLDITTFNNIIKTLKEELQKVDKNTLKSSSYLKYAQKNFLPAKVDIKDLKEDLTHFERQVVRNAEITLHNSLEWAIAENRSYLLSAYQCLQASAVFSEVWFINPRLYFSNSFFEQYLPSHNDYVKNNPIYPKTNLPKFPCDKEIFGQQVSMDSTFFEVYQLTPEIAKQILQHKQESNDTEFGSENEMFYYVVEGAAEQKFIVLVFHYDHLYIHNSGPI